MLTEGGFAGYFGLNRRRTKLHESFNGVFNLYISNSLIVKDLIMSIEDIKYAEYENPTDKIFKKFTK